MDVTAPSLQYLSNPQESPNPTLLPSATLDSFQFVFLIRKPSASIPSLYRCFIPPLSESTGEHVLDTTELGYRELRLLFDYLYPPASRSSETVNPRNSHWDKAFILVDADDLLAHPEAILCSVCNSLGIQYSSSMLSWPAPEDHSLAEAAFKKYAGYHEDALNSTGLRSKTADQERQQCRNTRTEAEQDSEWEGHQ